MTKPNDKIQSQWKDKFKVFVVGGNRFYANWIGETVATMEEADIVLFTGGEDVTPELYNEPQHPKTFCNPERDADESKAFDKAQELKKHCLGICRGSQFLCVMAGGKLVQHQENPVFVHNTISYDLDESFEITSTHHQAQYPYDLPKDTYRVLAWTKGISNIHQDGSGQEMPLPGEKECEIVFYKNTKSLGIQGHPEMMFRKDKYEHSFKILNKILTNFMNNVYDMTCGRTMVQIMNIEPEL